MYQDTDSRKLKKSLNILLIDDNQDDMEIICSLIDNSPMVAKLFTSTGLAEAYSIAEKNLIDVVLLDLSLNQSTGLETFLSFHKEFPNLAVVVMTGIKDEKIALKALQAGAQDFLVKGENDSDTLTRALRYAFERQLSDEALLEREGDLKRSQAIAGIGTWKLDLTTKTFFSSDEANEIYGLDEDSATWDKIKALPLAEYRTALEDELKNLVQHSHPYDIEFKIRRPNGEIRHIRSIADFSTEQNIVFGIIQDITQNKNLEAQVLQLEKMESIGRLAGGIAHDFNNMLCVILGHAEYLMANLNSSDPFYKAVKGIENAARRSANLTSQLLVFSRKQTLQLKSLDLNEIIDNLNKMLIRLIGENITLNTEFAPDLKLVKADQTHMEQVIMNLVINSRDAMQNGGSLTIATQNVELDSKTIPDCSPGQYVMFSVTDSGKGMDQETQKKIFEPFFTSKPTGKGTGLGLSTVYGIISHAKGYIQVQSELKRGTVFKIFLPVTKDEKQESNPKKHLGNLGSGELILIVEDEPTLLELIAEVFKTDLNYQVKTATNGGEALIMIEEEGLRPALLISDIIMPGMNGRVLYDRLLRTLPSLKVLFMSGYTNMALSDDDVYPFIQKPFRIDEIASKVYNILNEK